MTNKCVYGFHAVKTLLQNPSIRVEKAYLLHGRADARGREIISLLRQRNVQHELMTRAALDQLTNFAKHQGFAVLCAHADATNRFHANATNSFSDEGDVLEEPAEPENLEELVDRVSSSAFFLVLDGVQDPHNLGACLRTANAFGAHAVIAPRDSAAGLTSAVRKVACGAAETTPFFQVTNLARTLRMLKDAGIWIYGTAVKAKCDRQNNEQQKCEHRGYSQRAKTQAAVQNIYTLKLQPPLALVLGAEDSGLRRLTQELCDTLITIPMLGTVQSLNVAVAAGICLSEVARHNFSSNNSVPK